MGRLAIVFGFLLSVAAAFGVYYLYQGWVEERTIRGDVEAKYDQAKEKNLALQSEKEKYKTQSLSYRDKAKAIQEQLSKVQAEQKTVQDKLKEEKEAFEKQLMDRQGMIEELKKKMTELKKEAEDARQSCKVTPADMKTDFITTPQSFYPAQTSVSTPASGIVGTGTSNLVFQSPAATPVGTGSNPAAPVQVPLGSQTPSPAATQLVTQEIANLSGSRILTVNRKFNFVVINMGLQDGLKMADQLKVFKQGQKECAKIQVEKLYDKFSAAAILEENPLSQITEGDEVHKI